MQPRRSATSCRHGHDALPVHAPIGDEIGDGDGVRDKGLAVLALLAVVHAHRHLQRLKGAQPLRVVRYVDDNRRVYMAAEASHQP